MTKLALVLVHGLSTKPAPPVLQQLMVDALNRDDPKPEIFGYGNPGLRIHEQATIRCVYWADVFYADQYETDLSSYEKIARALESAGDGDEAAADIRLEGEPANMAEAQLPAGKTAEQQAFLNGLRGRFQLDSTLDDDYEAPLAEQHAQQGQLEQYQLERFPLPLSVKKKIIKRFAVEAYHYLFNEPFTNPAGKTFDVRTVLRKRLIDTLTELRVSHDRVVLATHSMGTMIGYDCLMNCAACPTVDGFMTIGSPLGVDEVQDGLIPGGDNSRAFPSGKLKGPWINVFDRLDPIAGLDPWFANDYRQDGNKLVRDIEEANWGKWRHTSTKYLKGPKLRAAMRDLLGLED